MYDKLCSYSINLYNDFTPLRILSKGNILSHNAFRESCSLIRTIAGSFWLYFADLEPIPSSKLIEINLAWTNFSGSWLSKLLITDNIPSIRSISYGIPIPLFDLDNSDCIPSIKLILCNVGEPTNLSTLFALAWSIKLIL